jgi:cbb3-type cytochrome oxidase maturation protein
MEIIVLLIAISISLALLFLGIFYWNIKNGQFDDTYTPSVRMLFDDKPKSKKVNTLQNKQTNKHKQDIEVPIEDEVNVKKEAKNHS